MSKETYQNKLDEIIARKDELQKGKETFIANINKLFLISKMIHSILTMNN